METDIKFRLIFRSIVFILALAGCKNTGEDHAGHNSVAYYTCPMHPSVKSENPGACPVCNMSLIKIDIQSNEHIQQKGNFISIDKKRQQLASIKTATVKLQNVLPTSTVLGVVAIDEERVKSISSQVKGRIEQLYIKASGEYVRKGVPLYAIYSEQLFADEKEFLALLDLKNNNNNENMWLNEILSASRSRLLLWGLSERQIEELENSESPSAQIVFYAQADGYVIEVLVKEGEYVEIGTPLIKVSSLDQVWIDALVYSNEIENIRGSSSFLVTAESDPGQVYTGRLVFSNPSLEGSSKVQRLRLQVDNYRNMLIPGMMVYVNPQLYTAPVLAVPKSAVLYEKMKTVWVVVHDDTFEQRMVECGVENKYWIEVLSGLEEGETIVAEGAYLISSEFILKSGAGQRHNH